MADDSREVLGLMAWYDGGQIFKVVTPLDFAELPDDGVLEIVVYFDDGRRNFLGAMDYYFYAPHADGPIYGSDIHTTADEIRRRYPGAVVKRGKWVPEATMARVTAEALDAKWDS